MKIIIDKSEYKWIGAEKKLFTNEVRSHAEFTDIGHELKYPNQKKLEVLFEDLILDSKLQYGEISLVGLDYSTKQYDSFTMPFQFKINEEPRVFINWRESIVPGKTGFISRIRAAYHITHIELELNVDTIIYLTEQVTPFYTFIKDKFPKTIGSEYLGDNIPGGKVNENGIRHEDLEELTFENNSIDVILSFDVFEHVQDYVSAFKETRRVLKKGGKMIFTVPFNYQKYHTVRALVDGDRNLIHLMEPEYHGNPVSSKGALCYRYFSFYVLEELKNAGFSDAKIVFYWSDYYMYLGVAQFVVVATK